MTTASLFQAGSPSLPLAPGDDAAALLDAAGPLERVHALVIGHDTLETLCGLIRRGCGAAVEMTLCGRLPAEPAEIVLVPKLASLSEASQAIALARRVLLPCGRVVLRTGPGLAAGAVVGLLRAAGFSAIRMHGAGCVVTADWPMFTAGASRYA